MAYFACGAAARTGTDTATRISIGQGHTSPTFISTVTGKKTLRGVVQSDIVSERNVNYVTSSNISERIKAAMSASAAAGRSDKKVFTIAKTLLSTASPIKGESVSLHEGSSGTIKTSITPVISKKMLAVTVIGMLVALWIGNKVL